MTAYNFAQLVPDVSYSPRYEAQNYALSMVEFQYTLTTALLNADTITTPVGALPNNGIRIAEIELIHPPLDTNASPTLTYSVGDANLAARFVSNASAGGTAGTQIHRDINIAQGLTNGVVSSGSNYLYGSSTSVDTPVQLVLTITAGGATAATSGVIRMKVWYWDTGEES